MLLWTFQQEFQTLQRGTMGWKNVDTIIRDRLYLGKYVAYYARDVSLLIYLALLVSTRPDLHGA